VPAFLTHHDRRRKTEAENRNQNWRTCQTEKEPYGIKDREWQRKAAFIVWTSKIQEMVEIAKRRYTKEMKNENYNIKWVDKTTNANVKEDYC